MIRQRHQVRDQWGERIVSFCGKTMHADMVTDEGDHCLRCLYSMRKAKGDSFMRFMYLPLVERVVYGEFGRRVFRIEGTRALD